MPHLERLSGGSDRHQANIKGDTVQLSPVGNSRDELERFQSVVRDAYDNEGDDYEVILDHFSSQYSGDLYDMIVLKKLT